MRPKRGRVATFSNLWALLGDVASRADLARLSLASKIPFQTRLWSLAGRCCRAPFGRAPPPQLPLTVLGCSSHWSLERTMRREFISVLAGTVVAGRRAASARQGPIGRARAPELRKRAAPCWQRSMRSWARLLLRCRVCWQSAVPRAIGPSSRELAERYATDPEYRQSRIIGKVHEDAGRQ
jgi:hypothetical protein